MNPTRRIAVILIGIFLIPALFFSVYEMSSLSRDEKMIEQIYQKQLEAILFSVNQYSDDAVNSWMTKLDTRLANNTESLEEFLTLNSSVLLFFSIDTLEKKPVPKVFCTDSAFQEKIENALLQVVSNNLPTVAQLLKYQRSGFQKLVTLNDSSNLLAPYRVLAFVSKAKSINGNVCG